MQLIGQFIGEFLIRLFSKNPLFFKIIQVLAAILGVANVTINQLASTDLIKNSNILSVLTSGVTLAISITTVVLAQLPKADLVSNEQPGKGLTNSVRKDTSLFQLPNKEGSEY